VDNKHIGWNWRYKGLGDDLRIVLLTYWKHFDIIKWQLLNIVSNRTGGGSCEKNLSTEQKKTPKGPRFQSPDENGRRPQSFGPSSCQRQRGFVGI